MASGFGAGRGYGFDQLQRDSAGDSPIDPGLPLLASDPQAGRGDTHIRRNTRYVEKPASLRDGDGRSAVPDRRQDREQPGSRNSGRLRAGNERDGAGRGDGQATSLATPGALDRAKFPHVEDGHWRPFEQTASEAASARLGEGDDLPTDRLNRLASKALVKIDEILSIPLDPDSEAYLTLLRVQSTSAQTALATQIRVDDQQFRQQQADRLPDLLARLVAASGEMA